MSQFCLQSKESGCLLQAVWGVVLHSTQSWCGISEDSVGTGWTSEGHPLNPGLTRCSLSPVTVSDIPPLLSHSPAGTLFDDACLLEEGTWQLAEGGALEPGEEEEEEVEEEEELYIGMTNQVKPENALYCLY